MEKFTNEFLIEHVNENHLETLEERALFFSVKHQSVYSMMKALGMTRKKILSSMRKEVRRKEMNFVKKIELEKENNIVYA